MLKKVLFSLLVILIACQKQPNIIHLDGGTFDIHPVVILDTSMLDAGETTGDTIRVSNMYDPAIITHELFHLTVNTLQWANIPFNDSTEEIYAYQLDYYVEQYYRKINHLF